LQSTLQTFLTVKQDGLWKRSTVVVSGCGAPGFAVDDLLIEL
jgi:hypothetical protein